MFYHGQNIITVAVCVMNRDLELLKQIQEWDKRIYQLKDQLDEVPKELATGVRELDQEKAQLKQLDDELKKLQLEQKSREGDLTSKEENIRKFQVQLTQVKTNKEYTILQSEINSMKADNSFLEEAIIGLLDRVDILQEQIRNQKKDFATKQMAYQEKAQALEEQAKAMRSEIDALSKQKQEKIKDVQSEAASLYERIVEKKRGLAFVKVEGEVCGACQITLRPQILNEVMLKEKVVTCENCSRMLYID